MMKYGVILIGMIVVFASGYFFSQWIFNKKLEKTTISNEVVMERVKNVAKLVTVEGYFTEMFNYKNYYGYDWSIFRKKALVRVKAKVSMGIDLQKMNLTFDEKNKIVKIGPLPAPEIISMDHTLDYYDISEGTFNSFAPEDFNKISKDAKSYITNAALKSDLPSRARVQTNTAIETIKIFAESAGWSVRVDTSKSVLAL